MRVATGLLVLLAAFASAALAAPTVSAIAPASGNTAGGTPVTVTGAGFVTGATVSIGGVPCTQVKLINSTTIVAVAGAHAAGTVTVQVCNPPSDCSAAAASFTYNSTSDFTKTTQVQFEAAGATLTNVVTTGLDSTLRWTDWTPTTGGSMAPGTYYYAVTAVNATGETRRSVQSAGAVVGGANNAVHLSWTAIPGALQYRIYRSTVSGVYGANSRVTTVTAPSYTDVAAATSAGTPPGANGATGDLALAYGAAPAASFSTGPGTGTNVDFGSFSLQRPDGAFLIIHGANGTATTIYDPVTNTMSAGPALAGNADRGSHAVHRPNGTWLIVNGDRTTGTTIYDPVANTTVSGPATTAAVGWGGGSIKRPDGKFLIIHANNSSSTSIYDPVTNTMAAGPAMTGNADEAAQALARPDGKYLICRGNNFAGTTIYDPVANTMAAGPSLTGGLGRGGYAIQRPDGRWLVVHGTNSSGTTLYDPVANATAAGPTTTSGVQDGAHAIQRADGKFLLFLGRSTTTTNLYDPATNTIAVGPATASAINDGSHSLQRPDGRYLVMCGNGTTTMLYDAGWKTSGQFISEAIHPADINWWNSISWTRDTDDTLTVYVRTATTSGGLASAAWRAATNGGAAGAAVGETWLQVRVDFARGVPKSQPALDDVWGRWRAEFRAWAVPLVPSVTANYTPQALSVATSKSTFAYGSQSPNTWLPADSTTLSNDGSVTESLVGRISAFSDGSNTWSLSPSANGAEQIRAQYSTATAAGPWTDIGAYASDFVIANSVGAADTLKLYFRIQSPTTTVSGLPFSSTLTVTAQ